MSNNDKRWNKQPESRKSHVDSHMSRDEEQKDPNGSSLADNANQ